MVLFVAMGFLVLRGWSIFKISSRRTRITMAIFAISAISYGSWHLVGDFLFPRRAAEGIVVKKTISRGLGRTYYVYIDGRLYKTTGDILDSLVVGTRVRVEFGVGSDTIFRVDNVS